MQAVDPVAEATDDIAATGRHAPHTTHLTTHFHGIVAASERLFFFFKLVIDPGLIVNRVVPGVVQNDVSKRFAFGFGQAGFAGTAHTGENGEAGFETLWGMLC